MLRCLGMSLFVVLPIGKTQDLYACIPEQQQLNAGLHVLMQKFMTMLNDDLLGPACRVQDELRMLPGFNASGMEQSSSPSQQHNYSSSSRSVVHPSYPPAQPPPREGDPRQDSPFLPSDSEEDSSFIAADDDPADEEEAAAAVDDNTPESAVEAAAEGAGHVTASSEEEAEKGSAAADESTSAGEDSNEYRGVPQKLSEEDLGMHIQSLERQSAEAMTKAAESVTAAAEAVTKASHHQIQSVPAGSAIPDEYLRRMHMSSRTPLPGGLSTPTPPQGAPAGSNVPRRWTKNNSYPDGWCSSCSCCPCSSATC